MKCVREDMKKSEKERLSPFSPFPFRLPFLSRESWRRAILPRPIRPICQGQITREDWWRVKSNSSKKERLKKMVFTGYNSLHSEYSLHKTSSTDQRATLFYTIVPRGKYCCSVSINSSMCQCIVGDLMNRLIKLLSNCHVNGQPVELHFVILIPLASAHHRWQPLTLWGSDKPIRELPHASFSKLD